MLCRVALGELLPFCAMDSKDLLWISATINLCTVIFFAARGLIGRLLVSWRERLDDKSIWRSLVDKHEDEPWRLPRFCVDVIQSIAMTGTGVLILCVDGVIYHPFQGSIGSLTAAGFAIAIGCYIYRVAQDSVLHVHLKHFKVDVVHHLVAIAVCCVFLTYRENALFGALGLISTGSVPSIEVSRLLKTLSESSGKSTASMPSYRLNLIIGAIITFITRLILPLSLCIYAVATSTPLKMSVAVVAFFFTSLMFFGSISVWLCVTSVRAIYYFNRRQKKDTYVNALSAGENSQMFPTKPTNQPTILAKKNHFSRLPPMSNMNVTPSTSCKIANNYSLPNKMPVNDILNSLSYPYSAPVMTNAGRFVPSDSSSISSDLSSAGEMTVLQVGDDGESARQRTVRFLVPSPRSTEEPLNPQHVRSYSLPQTASGTEQHQESRHYMSHPITTSSSSATSAAPTAVTSEHAVPPVSNVTSPSSNARRASSTSSIFQNNVAQGLPRSTNNERRGSVSAISNSTSISSGTTPARSVNVSQTRQPATDLGLRGWRDASVTFSYGHRRTNSLGSIDRRQNEPRSSTQNLSHTDTEIY